MTQYLISKHLQDESARRGYYGSPLHTAEQGTHQDLRVTAVLGNGENADIRDVRDRIPMHFESRNGGCSIVQQLLDLNGRQNKRATPLRRVATETIYPSSYLYPTKVSMPVITSARHHYTSRARADSTTSSSYWWIEARM
jgi:ankyrin repeat protein